MGVGDQYRLSQLGDTFYFWLSTGTNGNCRDGHGFGDAVAIFNPNGAPVTITFYRGSGRGVGGTFWSPLITQTIQPDSIFMVGGSVDMRFAPTTPKLAGNPYFYGTWSKGSADTTTVYDEGDYAVSSNGAPIMVWKSNMFACTQGTATEPNDNFAYGVDAATGTKVGTKLHGVAGGANLGEILITNMNAGTSNYTIYKYTPTNPVPGGGTADTAFPTGTWAGRGLRPRLRP